MNSSADNLIQNHEYAMWVILDNPQLDSWKEIDFKLGFQLSRFKNFQKTAVPENLKTLISETQWPYHENKAHDAWTLVGAQNNLPTKWILVIHETQKFTESHFNKIIENLNIKSVRFYKPYQPAASLIARLSHYEVV